MKRMLVALTVLGFVCASAVAAQAQEAEPAPELKKLEILLGDWAWEEQGKDTKSGEEWKAKGTGQYKRLGDFFFVWRGEAEGGTFTSIDGYDPVKKALVRHGFHSNGWKGTATVTLGDKTLTADWTGVAANGEKTRRRCTGDLVVPKSEYACEDFADGEWKPSVKGISTKVE